jgi:GR25 family glycosyltransferase involved in LPS biosynthesis
MEHNYKVYCLSYNNSERQQQMENRFKNLGVDYFIYGGVNFSDERIAENSYKKCWSCMYGHLDMINMFYQDNSVEFGIFCEDDILIHKDFTKIMPNVIKDFNSLNLDILLLGYLLCHHVENLGDSFNTKSDKYSIKFEENEFKYYNYNNDLWGTQMYLLSKENAGKILEKYYNGYALETLNDNNLTPFSADWTITKSGNRALIYPCLALETGVENYTNYDCQYYFHKSCFEFQFKSNTFI